MYTDCDEYDRLHELSGSIITYLMLAYVKEP